MRRFAVLEREDPGDALAESRRGSEVRVPFPNARVELLEEVGVAGQSHHRPGIGAHLDLVDLPAEDRAVEPGSAHGVTGLQLAEVPGAWRVHGCRALQRARLPEAETSTGWIDAGHLSSQIADGGWLGDHRPAGVADPDDCGISVVDTDAGAPRRRLRGSRPSRADRRDLAAVNGRDRVGAGCARRCAVINVPSEEAGIEAG